MLSLILYFSLWKKRFTHFYFRVYFLIDFNSSLYLLLLLSRLGCVRLCATPKTAAHQAPPSLGVSRQEHWSGLPFSVINVPSIFLLFTLNSQNAFLKPFSHQQKNEREKKILSIHKLSLAKGKVLAIKYINEIIKSQLKTSQWLPTMVRRKSHRLKGPDNLAPPHFSQLTSPGLPFACTTPATMTSQFQNSLACFCVFFFLNLMLPTYFFLVIQISAYKTLLQMLPCSFFLKFYSTLLIISWSLVSSPEWSSIRVEALFYLLLLLLLLGLFSRVQLCATP